MIPYWNIYNMKFLIPDIAFFQIHFTKFCVVEIWSIYFCPEKKKKTIIEYSNSFYEKNIILKFFFFFFFTSRMNKFLHY